jgi:hypothetical protein
MNDIIDRIRIPGSVLLVHGDICDGKTILINDVMCAASISRSVFALKHAYTNILDEASSILSAHPTSVLVAENCFSMNEDRLLGLARQVAASGASLVLSARGIATEAESGKLRSLRTISTFSEIEIGRLGARETNDLINLIDQIAGWRKLSALSHQDRQRFISNECRGAIPGVLLQIFNSDYVKNKYKEEFQKTSSLSTKERQVIIASLLLANIGFDAQVSFVSDVFMCDFTSTLRAISAKTGGLRLIRIEGDVAKTIPSIGARNILKHVVDDHEIVNAIIFILETLAHDSERGGIKQHIFTQLMRYSILTSVVEDADEVNRFFDHISKINYFRGMPLFWLQWHMAMYAQERWLDAEKYLEMGYKQADAYEKRYGDRYNRKQLDDRKAKFLAARALSSQRTGFELFRDLKEGLDIVNRLLRDENPTHHPFLTLKDVIAVFETRGGTIDLQLHDILQKQMSNIRDLAQKKLPFVPPGYQRSHAQAAISQLTI